jgi:hypothetical protein
MQLRKCDSTQVAPRSCRHRLLLELLNASEGLVARDALPPEVLDVAEQEALPPVTAEAQRAEAVEVPGHC